MILNLHCSSDYSITDGRGQIQTIEDARKAVDAGKVTDCNLAFERLVRLGFDIEAVKKFYEENP